MTPGSLREEYMGYRPVVQVFRGKVVESVHLGAIVVANRDGNLIASWGDPEQVTYLRSSAKPLQALPLLESGAAEHFGFTDEQIAVICASHTGTNSHVATVAAIQSKIGVSETELVCGVHPPYDEATMHSLVRAGLAPTPNRHNCSGKHSGMLALARFLGASLQDYAEPGHPVQRRIRLCLAEMCGLSPFDVLAGIDGCSVPNFAVPLRSAAMAFARLAEPEALLAARAKACQRVFSAMTAHPEMAGGSGRFDTRLIQSTGGRLLVKAGAEGYIAVTIPPGGSRLTSSGLGLVIKIADGDPHRRAVAPVTLAALEALGVLTPEELGAMESFGSGTLTNYRGLRVGELRTCFQV